MLRSERLFRTAALALLGAAAGCAAPVTAPRAPATPTLVNASSVGAYNDGLYDGFITVAELRARGGFGLGAADRNDGELTVLDGVYYCAHGDGTVVALPDDAAVPLASVTQFRPDHRLHVKGPLTPAQLQAQLDEWLPGANRLYALRIHGRFSRVLAGASAPQSKPYRRFGEVKPEYHMIPREGVIGTLVGFRMPTMHSRYYHFHLISDDKRVGGHVDDQTIDDADIEAEELHRVEIILPTSPAFVAADFASSAPRVAPAPAPAPSAVPAPGAAPAPSAAPAAPAPR